MTDNEKIQSFGDMVDATEQMSSPWRETAFRLIKALIITNLFWAVIVAILLLQPKKVTQEQHFTQAEQSQSYTEGAMTGD